MFIIIISVAKYEKCLHFMFKGIFSKVHNFSGAVYSSIYIVVGALAPALLTLTPHR